MSLRAPGHSYRVVAILAVVSAGAWALNLAVDKVGFVAIWWILAATSAFGTISFLRELPPRAPLVQYTSRLLLATAAVVLGFGPVVPSGWRLPLIVISVASAVTALLVRNVPLRDLVDSVRSGVRGGGDLLSKWVTGLAARLAGRRRASDAEVWRAHLLGGIGSGRSLTPWRQLRIAFGFLVAAVRMRWRDVCRQLCRPFDWLVARDSRIAKLLVLVGFAVVASLYRVSGWARVWDDFEQVGVLLGIVSGAAYGWRKLRGIESPPREPRRRGEDA